MKRASLASLSTFVAIFVAVFVAVTVAPSVAFACPVCFSGSDETREAFLLTTALLTFLPLAMIGAFVYVLVVRSREIDAEERAEAAGPGLAPPLESGLFDAEE